MDRPPCHNSASTYPNPSTASVDSAVSLNTASSGLDSKVIHTSSNSTNQATTPEEQAMEDDHALLRAGRHSLQGTLQLSCESFKSSSFTSSSSQPPLFGSTSRKAGMNTQIAQVNQIHHSQGLRQRGQQKQQQQQQPPPPQKQHGPPPPQKQQGQQGPQNQQVQQQQQKPKKKHTVRYTTLPRDVRQQSKPTNATGLRPSDTTAPVKAQGQGNPRPLADTPEAATDAASASVSAPASTSDKPTGKRQLQRSPASTLTSAPNPTPLNTRVTTFNTTITNTTTANNNTNPKPNPKPKKPTPSQTQPQPQSQTQRPHLPYLPHPPHHQPEETPQQEYWADDLEQQEWQEDLVRRLVTAKHARLDETQGHGLRAGLRHLVCAERLEKWWRGREVRALHRKERARLREVERASKGKGKADGDGRGEGLLQPRLHPKPQNQPQNQNQQKNEAGNGAPAPKARGKQSTRLEQWLEDMEGD
ncbi:hypothetical protein GGR54DRAFT_612321 [Hypoxylon sp. NC1633]|nr:hypothetical protein GGR54DRAFT_612321 [Hypoxylon sp. NC1633]